RCLLRLLCRDYSGLVNFNCDFCFSTDQAPRVQEGIQVFIFTNPAGRYKLDLVRPYHRTILRMLYEYTEYKKLTPDATFQNISFTPGSFSHPSGKDQNLVWPVPTSGNLEMTFSIDKVMEVVMKGTPDDRFTEVLGLYNEAMRFKPGYKKLVTLIAQWKSLEGNLLAQSMMLNALARDFIFDASHVDQLCLSKSMT
ncbi:unnamed protein product, partial [Polarella glacialis]